MIDVVKNIIILYLLLTKQRLAKNIMHSSTIL